MNWRDDDDDENYVSLRFNIVVREQKNDLEFDGNIKIIELFAIIAEFVEMKEICIRLMFNGERIFRETNKTISQYFNDNPGDKEILVFFESLGP